MPAYEILNLRFSAVAGGTVSRRRFVKAAANDTAVQAGAGEAAIGVSMNSAVLNDVLEIADGIVIVEAGGAISANDAIQSDADGKAALRTTGIVVGTALTAASDAGELVAVKTPGCTNVEQTVNNNTYNTITVDPAAAVADLTAGAAAGLAASLITGTVNGNTGITYTAQKIGVDGNDITVAYVNPGTPSAALGVVVTDSDIVVNLATTAGTASSGTSGVAGNNNGITWTAATVGTVGDDIVVILEDPDDNNQALGVTVNGRTIIVSLATDGGGAISSTAAQVWAAVNADPTASAIVTGANTGVSTGAIAPTDEIVQLANGVDPVPSSTATQVIAAVESEATALALVKPVSSVLGNVASTGAGTVVAVAETALTGGVDSEGQECLVKINELLVSLRAAGLLAV